MGKNAHAPRGQKNNKTSPAAPESNTTANDGGAASSKDDKKKAKAAEPSVQPGASQEPKKPDTRTLIGGASWTGKLPVNLLSEHCQKQKWEKPEYTMSKSPDDGSYSSMVILKKKDSKTQEITAIPPFRLPPSHKHLASHPTAIEARHFAAAYALYRVCSMRNIHMTMPPTYRDLWKGEFQLLKKEDEKAGMLWKYDADPFQANREREKIQQKKEAAAEAASSSSKSARENNPGATVGSAKVSMKGWTTAAKVEMGEKTRREVEHFARIYSTWNPLNIKIPLQEQNNMVEHFSKLGFRRSHISEASEICKDQEEVLEWLLIHVPEDDLPNWALPEGYAAGISLASGDLKQDAAVQRLASGGYSSDICRSMYDHFKGNERQAAQALQNSLLGVDDLFSGIPNGSPNNRGDNSDDLWTAEQEILSSIYEEKYKKNGTMSCTIQTTAPEVEGNIICTFTRPLGLYPTTPPILTINARIPSYIRLSIAKQALEHAQNTLLGEQMVFNLVDWLEQNISSILFNPGPLTSISGPDENAIPKNEAKRSVNGTSRKTLALHTDRKQWSSLSKQIWSEWKNRQGTDSQQKMLKSRRALPAWELQEAIVNAVNAHQVVIISGETGSGKSTQTVQFILDDMIQNGFGETANIVCTQPRRISAMGLADRVSQERCSVVGKEVGYAIRGESKQSDTTSITFVTTGVLLRRMQTAGDSMKEVIASLTNVSHVIVDEVHERSLDTDFLLALLRDVLKERSDLKLILMSATLDAHIFEQYFGGPSNVAKIEIYGRTFPINDFYLDDAVRATKFGQNGSDDINDEDISRKLQQIGMGINYEMIASLVHEIDRDLGTDPGGILIFLPGTAEIQRVLGKLEFNFGLHALPLHASLLPSEQRQVFQTAPKGKRKVVAATNVAETSITIDDIVAVIDTGRVKETRYDSQSNMIKLEEVWASRAACQQRRGRAGRVRAGICYKLYTRNAELKMAQRPDPEIKRVPLEQLCLSVKAMGLFNVGAFLANTLTPPEETAVEGALALLQRIGALDGEHLTSLGRHLSMIPADLRCAKLMVFGALFDYLEECVLIASILSVKSPFVNPQDKRDEAKAARTSFANGQGDLIADLHACQKWMELRKDQSAKEIRAWCQRNFLSVNTLSDIASNRSQYLTTLKDIGFIPLDYQPRSPPKQISYPFLNAIILSALHPQVSRISLPPQKYQSTVSGALPVDPESREIKYFDAGNDRVFIHPSSTVFSTQHFANNATFLSYYKKMETSKVFVNEITPCGSFGLMLFGGPIELDTQGRGIVVDGWAKLRGWARIGMLVSRLRVILDRVLNTWIDQPAFGSQGDMEDRLVQIVTKLIELEGMDA